MLRYVTEGLVQLMAVRAATKNELRADVTVIQPRGNNPLKLSPDARAVLLQLLAPPTRGFLAGPAAMREATNDLQSHLIGMMAGMRAALSGMLERFEPAELEEQMDQHAFLDGILPGNRKARLWSVYLEHYRTIHAEAAEGFHRLFGKAFVDAYEEQVTRLEQGRSDRGEGDGR
jgi:FHA domain-containing protein